MYVPVVSVNRICRREVGVLLDIIHAQQYTSEWQFLQAILAIQASDNKLQLWNGVVPLKVGAQCHVNTHLWDASMAVCM